MSVNPQNSDFHQLLENLYPLNEKSTIPFYDINGNITKVFTIESVFEDIFETFIKTNDIGTMAYENSEDYAKLSHDHDNYTSATYESSSEAKISDDIVEFVNFGTVKNYVQTIKHDGEAEKEYKKYQQKIGTVMFMPSNTKETEDWVLANGQQMDVSEYEYQDILKKFYGIDNNIIKKPNLNGFFKPYPYIHNCLSLVEGKNCILNHAHNITFDDNTIEIIPTDITIEGDNTISSSTTGTTNTKNNTTHNGDANKETQQRTAKLTRDDWNFSLNGLETVSTTRNTEDKESSTYPSNVTTAAYIYIGNKGKRIPFSFD